MCLARKLAIYLVWSTQMYWNFQLIYFEIDLIRCQQHTYAEQRRRWRTWNDFAHRNDYRRANIWLVTINSVMHTGTRRKTNDSTQHISSVCLCALIHCNLSTIKLSSDYDECNAISISLLLLLLNNDFNYLSRTPWNASFVIPREHSSFFVCLLIPFCTILFSKRSLHLQFYYSISIFYVYTYSGSIAINYLQYHIYRLYTRTSR